MTTTKDDPGGGRPRSPRLELPFKLAEQDQKGIVELLAELRRTRIGYRFPWENLEADLANSADDLHLFGYGSLLNLASAVETIPGSREGLKPAVAFGLIRVFDYIMPDEFLRRHGPLNDPQARAALNVYPTRHLEDVVNGVLVTVKAADLTALRAREAGYDLVPVPCLAWPSLSGVPVVTYALSCPQTSADGIRRTDGSLLPHLKYRQMCLDGARAVSPEFLELFLATTDLGWSEDRLDAP